MSQLFSPLRLRSLELKNRIFVSPMCQYSCELDGVATPWHFAHLARFATGGASLVFTEATAISPEGRISPHDLGIWSDAHADALRPIVAFLHEQGAVAGVQLAHAGRKASTEVPWRGGQKVDPSAGGWTPVAPSALPFSSTYPEPVALDEAGIEKVIDDFVASAKRALRVGFKVVELHFAHGYLIHQFLSPITNRRDDAWGERTKLPLAVARAVREVWPEELPLFVRVSATDWIDGGWDLPQTIALAKQLREIGVDLIDCSSGGIAPGVRINVGPGYQVPFAEAVRNEANVATGAVGMITNAQQAEEILASGRADAVLLARAMLSDPNWALHAARSLGVDVPWPVQYVRAKSVVTVGA